MAVDLGNLANNVSNMNARGNRSADLPEADVYLNIVFKSQDDKGEALYISLPRGIAIDTMEPVPLTTNAEFNVLVEGKNQFLEQIQLLAAQLEPGEERIIAETPVGICLQLRRRKAIASTGAAGANPHVNALKSLRFG